MILCFEVNCFIDFIDEREWFLWVVINCKFFDVCGKLFEFLFEVGLFVIEVFLLENDWGIYKGIC